MKKLTITGNLGRDPELRVDSHGNQFAVFSVAVPVGTKANPKTDWVDVSCNGKLAEFAITYAKKGNRVLVEGFPAVNSYINKDKVPVGVQRLYAHVFEILNKVEREINHETVAEAHLLTETSLTNYASIEGAF